MLSQWNTTFSSNKTNRYITQLFIFGKNMFSLEETFTIESLQPAI